VSRYGGQVIRDRSELFSVFDVPDSEHLEDVLEFHGDVVLQHHSVELVVGTEALGLQYPFTAEDLTALADALIAAD
jgi:hypothetical protein